MSIHYGQFCPISKAAEVLGERWTILVLRELLVGASRFSDIQRALSQMSPTLLAKRLTQLQDSGLVVRKAVGERRYEYFLTAAGKELQPVIMGLGEWGARWARGQMNDDELDVELLMVEFRRRLDRAQLPAGSTVIKFVFVGLARFPQWWIVVGDGQDAELCTVNPGKDVDVTLRSDLRTMTKIWAGDITLRAARSDGVLQVSGNPVLTKTLASWLRPGLMAHVRPVTPVL